MRPGAGPRGCWLVIETLILAGNLEKLSLQDSHRQGQGWAGPGGQAESGSGAQGLRVLILPTSLRPTVCAHRGFTLR